VDEERKDQIEDIGVAVAEAVASLIPIVGGPTAVILNRTLGSAVQRRQARILIELRDDLTRLEQFGLVTLDEQLAESEPFQAALQRTVRQLLEADSDDKRTLLRNALLNRLAGMDADNASRFDEALERVQADDVVLLAKIREEVLAFDLIWSGPDGWTSPDVLVRSDRTKRLLRLGLIDELAGTVAETQRIVNAVGEDRYTSDTTASKHGISTLGRDFLAYVSDPTASPTSTPPSDVAPR
jgi:hypothetical protein